MTIRVKTWCEYLRCMKKLPEIWNYPTIYWLEIVNGSRNYYYVNVWIAPQTRGA